MISGGYGGNITIWNSETGYDLRTLRNHTNTIWTLKVLKNGTLASGSRDNTVKIWNPQSGHLLRTLDGHKGWVNTLEELSSSSSSNDDDGLLVSGSYDKTVKKWNTRTGELLNTVEMPDYVFQIVLLRDSNLAIQCRYLAQIIILNPQNLREVKRIDCGEINKMTLLSDGSYLATCQENISLWDPSSGNLVRTLNGHKKGITCLQALDDGSLASGSWDGKIKIWNPTNGQMLHSFKSHDISIYSITTLSDGSLVSCSGDSEKIKIWK